MMPGIRCRRAVLPPAFERGKEGKGEGDRLNQFPLWKKKKGAGILT